MPRFESTVVEKADVSGLDGIEEAHQHAVHPLQQHGDFFQHPAAAQILGVMDHHLDAEDTLALVVDLQGKIAPFQLEYRQIVTVCLHGLGHLRRPASRPCPVVMAMPAAENRFDRLQIEWRAGAIDELLEHLIHRRPAAEHQIAAQLKLKDRILIGEG
jgi:hypothetical protein